MTYYKKFIDFLKSNNLYTDESFIYISRQTTNIDYENKEERQNNIQGVYSLQNPQKITNQKILLVDDIYTTGSTVNECSKILKQANPKKIGVLVLAKD